MKKINLKKIIKEKINLKKIIKEKINLKELKKKVSNSDMYYVIQDKWMEKMYNGFKGVLDEDQWKKYLKSGAERQKKARDKRAAKASK